MAEEPAEVVAALAQRRDHDLVAGEPVEQRRAEAAGLDRASRSASVAAISRTSTLLRAGAADPLHLAGLEHAQQHHLHLGRGLADLVEEQRAAVGAAGSSRAGRGPRR